MNSLLNYGSDDDESDESGDEKRVDSPVEETQTRTARKNGQEDANYDEVQMDLSEDSNDSKSGRQPDRDDRHERKRSPKYRNEGSKRREWRNEERSSRSSRDREEDRGSKYRHEESRSERRDRERTREDRYGRRDKKRSRSRERKRSRSPKREQSGSEERSNRSYRRQERTNNKMDRLDKMGIELKTPENHFVKPAEQKADAKPENSKDRFFMPGITGRFRDQIERRKLLWQKKEAEPAARPTVAPVIPTAGGSRSTKVWETTTFAQDTDGKVASKFKRLMGIRNPGEETSRNPTDVLKKQEEMFSSMEQQYEVARTATHTMRGVGLGFGSFQR